MDNLTDICEATSQSQELEKIRPIHRKGKKLLAEKKRRARINNCLIQIRRLVCEDQDEKDTDIDKMEKAEILEKTLEVLTRLRHEGSSNSNTALTHKAMAMRYASGFSLCAEESIRYIQNSRLVPNEVKVQLQNHLRAVARRVESTVQVVNQSSSLSPGLSSISLNLSSPPSSEKFVRGGTLHSAVDNSPVLGRVSRQFPGDVSESDSYHLTSPFYFSTPVSYQHLPSIKPRLHLQELDRRLMNCQPETHLSSVVRQKRKSSRVFHNEVSSKSRHMISATDALSLTSDSGFENSQHLLSFPHSAQHHLSSSSSLITSGSSLSESTLSTNSPMLVSSSSVFHTTPTLSQGAQHIYPGYGMYLPSPGVLEESIQECGSHVFTNTEVSTASKVLDLCVKRTEDQKISPDSMWRPW